MSRGRRRKQQAPKPGVVLALTLCLAAFVWFLACGPQRNGESTSVSDVSGVLLPVDLTAPIPEVRVWLRALSQHQSWTVAPDGPIRAECGGASLDIGDGETLSVRLDQGVYRVSAVSGPTALLAGDSVRVIPQAGCSSIAVGIQRFEGSFDFLLRSGRARVVNTVEMAAYVRGSIPSEMPASWPTEALKAQAVAIRSYTYFTILHHRSRSWAEPWDVDDTTMYLRYGGVTGADGKLEPRWQAAASAAESATARELVLYRGKLVKTYFHSTSGGRTTTSEVAFGQPTVPPLAGADLGNHGSASPVHRWSREFSASQVLEAAPKGSANVGTVSKAIVTEADPHGYVREIQVFGSSGSSVKIEASQLRRTLGTGLNGLPSTCFTVRARGDSLVFEGRGWGHGVGLDQWAARGMASSGKKYREILETMYPESEVVRVAG